MFADADVVAQSRDHITRTTAWPGRAPSSAGYVPSMPAAPVFREVVGALLDLLSEEVEVVGVEVTQDGGCVTVWTTTPRQVIGRRGVTAGELQGRLSEALGRPMVLRVELPDGDVDGVPTTSPAQVERPSPPGTRVRALVGGAGVPRPRIWRPEPPPEARAGGIVPPDWQ